jgi:2-(1,2-epoxy-1,2-dihydrophenyl)acetyl-CoA isomerase
MADEDPVLFEKTHDIAIVTLNRPDVLNAIDFNLGNKLIEVLSKISTDKSIRSLIITGVGRAFSSGGDINAMKHASDAGVPSLFMQRLIQMLNEIISMIRSMKIPVIAAIPGITSGGGLDLALSCDFRIASDRAKFKAAYTGIGLVPAGGGSYLLSSIIGPAKALEFFLLNDTMFVEEAFKIKLVNKIVPADQLMVFSLELANTLADGATTAYGYTKRLLNEFISGSGLEHQLAREGALQSEIMIKTTDFYEGIRAFLEKRAPKFSGK